MDPYGNGSPYGGGSPYTRGNPYTHGSPYARGIPYGHGRPYMPGYGYPSNSYGDLYGYDDDDDDDSLEDYRDLYEPTGTTGWAYDLRPGRLRRSGDQESLHGGREVRGLAGEMSGRSGPPRGGQYGANQHGRGGYGSQRGLGGHAGQREQGRSGHPREGDQRGELPGYRSQTIPTSPRIPRASPGHRGQAGNRAGGGRGPPPPYASRGSGRHTGRMRRSSSEDLWDDGDDLWADSRGDDLWADSRGDDIWANSNGDRATSYNDIESLSDQELTSLAHRRR